MKILQHFTILLHYDQRDAMRPLKSHRLATLWLRYIYIILHFEWCQCPRNRFHCANGLVVLRKCISEVTLSICAHWAKESNSVITCCDRLVLLGFACCCSSSDDSSKSFHKSPLIVNFSQTLLYHPYFHFFNMVRQTMFHYQTTPGC